MLFRSLSDAQAMVRQRFVAVEERPPGGSNFVIVTLRRGVHAELRRAVSEMVPPPVTQAALDGLEDAYQGGAMGTFAQATANEYQLTREQQDSYAIESLRRAQADIDRMLFEHFENARVWSRSELMQDLRVGDVEMDRVKRTVTRNDRQIVLTPKEST